MANTKNLSVLVEKQLPDFISSEYSNFSKFIEKYYEQLECQGQPLDIISNITKYRDIDFYEKELLRDNTVLSTSINDSSTTIAVQSTAGFPEKNGYILIDEEIIFYKTKTSNSFVDCYRNVSGVTKLGDIYHTSTFKSVNPVNNGTGSSHLSGELVSNVSNLFLYAFVKNFEKEYLDSFPEEFLKSQVDKRVLIKNIKSFYRAKGTDQSIKFIFNSIVAEDASDIPSVFYPKDSTIKSSSGDWVKNYGLQVRVISGNVENLIGNRIVQDSYVYDDRIEYAFAIVDDVKQIGDKDGVSLYEIILAEETVVGKFEITPKTYLTRELSSSYSSGDKVDVYSTSGWYGNEGELVINNEVIFFRGKNVNQFTILSRQNPSLHSEGSEVYSNSIITGYYDDEFGNTQTVKMISYGYLYDLEVSVGNPYSSVGDRIEISNSGAEPLNVIYRDSQTGASRWKINENFDRPSIPSQPAVQTNLDQVIADVSAMYEDESYFYVASSGFPSHDIGPFTRTSPQDQKNLKLIKKTPETTTEVYSTPKNDVGIFVNGVRAYSYKDEESVIFGELTEIRVTSQGSSYQDPPFVLIDGNAQGRAILSGEVVDHIEITNPGSGYTQDPEVTITSGRNAVITATVTGDRVTRLNIVDPGEYYSSPPLIVIRDANGRGRYASYTALVSSSGQITGFDKIEEGKFYTQENVIVEVIPVGFGATAEALVRRWNKNRLVKNLSELDDSNGAYFDNINPALGYGYGYVGNPRKLRVSLGDNLSSNGIVPVVLNHSPILGYAYDGNPIYGPYGYSDSLDSSSSIVRMTSGYSLKTSRVNGPSEALGTYIEDYEYTHRSGSLDNNNGRYCVTPEYPNGIYAYFLTIDANNNPVFPYILGENFYSLPVESNYGRFISQDELPKSSRRIRTDNTKNNGIDSIAVINDVTKGSLSKISVENSHNNFSVNSRVFLSDFNSDNNKATAFVSELHGKNVTSIQSQQTRILEITTANNVYLYDNDILTQQNTGSTASIVGNVINSNIVAVRVLSGTFNNTDRLDSNRRILSLILNQNSNYTNNSFVSLTTGNQTVIDSVSSNFFNVASNPFSNGDPISFTSSFNSVQSGVIYYVIDSSSTRFKISSTPSGSAVSVSDTSSPGTIAFSEKAYGRIIESSINQNILKVEVLRGTFDTSSGYFINSSDLTNTIGSRIFNINELSNNIELNDVNSNVALLTTSENHGVTVNDNINISIIPDSSTTTTEYDVRKRIYQKVLLQTPSFNEYLIDDGLGLGRILNSGDYYASSTSGIQTFNNVELYFVDQRRCRDSFGIEVGSSANPVIGNPGNVNNARANITVSGGKVTSVVITSKGSNYRRGDLLTADPDDLNRNNSIPSTRYFIFEVTHAGFAVGETVLQLSNVDQLSNDDILRIGDEKVRVVSINSSTRKVTVQRGVENTAQANHFNSQEVNLYNGSYRFNSNYQIGGSSSPFVISYDQNTQLLELAFSTSESLNTINEVIRGTTFFDQSTPTKIVTITSITERPAYKFEFSSDSGTTWERNPIIDVQRYYTYKFNLNNSSLSGTFLEFSPSRNFNILSPEIRRSSSLPGTSNSYVSIVFGFGNFYDSGSPIQKESINRYTSYFYYDKSDIVDSDYSYLNVVNDPLQGNKVVRYVTPNKILYGLNGIPAYDGSGTMSYTTTSTTSSGEISKFSLSNVGSDYDTLPTVVGVSASSQTEALLDCVWSAESKNIESVRILSRGLNYSKPKIIVTDGDGEFAEFSILKNSDNSLRLVEIINKGRNYTYKPTLKVIETDLEAYCESNNIGVPKSVRVNSNGFVFNSDKTTNRQFSSSVFLILKNFDQDAFLDGEEISQYDGSQLIARGYVAINGWNVGKNVLKLERVTGSFKENINIIGNIRSRTASVYKILQSIFSPDIRSYYDNNGYFASDFSTLSSASQRIADSYYYQDYSYVIKSKTPTNVWRNLIKKTIHPAGFNVFGELSIESEADTKVPASQPGSGKISIINLWDPVKNVVTVQSTTRKITEILVRSENVNIIPGKGSVFANEFDTGETLTYEFNLNADFNGYFDDAGNRSGTRTFTMQVLGSSSSPLTVSNIYNTIVSLDGIIQEPSKSYFIGGSVGVNASSSSSITFSQAPLGYRDIFGNSIPLASYTDGLDSPPQKFIGRYISLKNSVDNTNYFRKIADISNQFNNVQTVFDLYYEDGSPVQLSSGENLLISIDGVIQRQGVTPVVPFDRSYYIRKTVVPNQIVFVEPPRTFNSQKQSFFGFNISGAERLTIDERYIDGTYSGSYLLKSALTRKIISIDEERNLLVFIDGVLQDRRTSYVIRGASISFNEPLKPNQSVYILFVYGKKIQNSLTAFNFEQIPFLNRFEIAISGTLYPRDVRDAKIFSSSANGTIKKTFFDGTNTILTIDSLNRRFLTSENITIKNFTTDGQDYVIDSSRIVSIEQFEQNDNTFDILRKSYPGWLSDSQEKLKISSIHRNFIEIGDLIRIDGEREFREVLDIPKEVIKTDYRNSDDLTSAYYGKIPVTGYNDISLGEGLDVVAEISGGIVTSLIWNRKDYDNAIRIGLTPQSNNNGYENAPQLEFVSQPQLNSGGLVINPPQGGGAKAYTIIENGEVIDIVLYDGGSNYLVPPRVYVTKNYSIIKKSKVIDSDIIYIGMSHTVETGDTLYITSGESLSTPGGPPIQSFSSVLAVTPFDSDRKITSIIQKEGQVLIPESQHAPDINFIIEPYLEVLSSGNVITTIEVIAVRSPSSIDAISNVTISNVQREITTTTRSFYKIRTSPVYPSLYDTGAYLQISIDEDDNIIYIADTSKFTSAGKLLIGDEIVYYPSKFSDRFYNVLRGHDSTTAKQHLAGEFVRQYREDVTIIDVGTGGTIVVESNIVNISSVSVSTVNREVLTTYNVIHNTNSIVDADVDITDQINLFLESNSIIDVSTVAISTTPSVNTSSVSVSSQEIEIYSIINIQESINSVVSTTPEIERFYKTGVVDYYVETVPLFNIIPSRINGDIVLINPFNIVNLRDGSPYEVVNQDGSSDLTSYYVGNLGNTFGQINSWYSLDLGILDVSAMRIEDFEINYPTFTVNDFDTRANSSISTSNNIWNIGYPSINNIIVFAAENIDLSSATTLNVTGNTTLFPNAGTLFISLPSGYSVITYTGKTSSSFTGCVVIYGETAIITSSEIISH